MNTKVKRDGTVELVDGKSSIAIGRVEKSETRITHMQSTYSRVAAGYSYQTTWKCLSLGGRTVCRLLRTRDAAVRVLVDAFDSGKI